jgi:3-hydroxyacyl-[acyl-carrier-protein] dehydratase
MRWHDEEALRLGPDVVQRLIPHRRPLLMVDAVEAFRRAPQPTLWARRQISANEDVFAGHFPGLAVWPGIYTIEGLGQTSLLLSVILFLVAQHERAGGSSRALLDALRELDPARPGRPGTGAGRSGTGAGAAPLDLPPPDPRAGVAGQVEMKLVAPVYAGETLRYRASMTHTLDAFARFDVEAEVDGTAVARGTLTGMMGRLGGVGAPGTPGGPGSPGTPP